MTVKELKELLKDLPDDVLIHKTEGDFYPKMNRISIIKMYILPEKERVVFKRKYISAEIDKKYYALILDRLKNGYIKEEYRLKFKNKKENNVANLPLFNKVE